MTAPAEDYAQRVALVLVADEQVADRLPSALGYLQIGLLDEAIDVILVVPPDERSQTLAAGPTTAITHRPGPWLLSRFNRRETIARIRGRIDALPRRPPIIVHALALAVAPLALEIAADLDAPLVVSLASAAEIGAPENQAAMSSAALVIAPCQFIRRALAASAFSAKLAEVIPMGVPVSASPAAFHETEQSATLVFAGALGVSGRIETLLRAARSVLESHPGVNVLLVGKGPAESALRRSIDGLGIAQQVIFTGRLHNARKALDAGDIFCLPGAGPAYREEPLHALGAGLAIVAATDSLYDGLMDGETALLFPPGDDIRLAAQVTSLLADPPKARAMAAVGQAYCRKHHSIARMVAEHVRAYREMLSRGKTLPLAPRRPA